MPSTFDDIINASLDILNSLQQMVMMVKNHNRPDGFNSVFVSMARDINSYFKVLQTSIENINKILPEEKTIDIGAEIALMKNNTVSILKLLNTAKEDYAQSLSQRIGFNLKEIAASVEVIVEHSKKSKRLEQNNVLLTEKSNKVLPTKDTKVKEDFEHQLTELIETISSLNKIFMKSNQKIFGSEASLTTKKFIQQSKVLQEFLNQLDNESSNLFSKLVTKILLDIKSVVKEGIPIYFARLDDSIKELVLLLKDIYVSLFNEPEEEEVISNLDVENWEEAIEFLDDFVEKLDNTASSLSSSMSSIEIPSPAPASDKLTSSPSTNNGIESYIKSTPIVKPLELLSIETLGEKNQSDTPRISPREKDSPKDIRKKKSPPFSTSTSSLFTKEASSPSPRKRKKPVLRNLNDENLWLITDQQILVADTDNIIDKWQYIHFKNQERSFGDYDNSEDEDKSKNKIISALKLMLSGKPKLKDSQGRKGHKRHQSDIPNISNSEFIVDKEKNNSQKMEQTRVNNNTLSTESSSTTRWEKRKASKHRYTIDQMQREEISLGILSESENTPRSWGDVSPRDETQSNDSSSIGSLTSPREFDSVSSTGPKKYNINEINIEEIEPYLEEADSNENIIFSDNDTILGATLPKIIQRLTHESFPDLSFLETFLVTYRTFLKPLDFLSLLEARWNSKVPNGYDSDFFKENMLLPRRLRVFNVLKIWIEGFYFDFCDENMTLKLSEFLDVMKNNGMVGAAQQLERIIEKKSEEPKKLLHDASLVDVPTPDPIIPTSSSSIRDMHPKEVARQICLLEYDLLTSIQPPELLESSWTKKNKETIAPNVLAMIRFTNHISKWIVNEILSQEDIRIRAMIVNRFIFIAKCLKDLNNLNGVIEVISGLRNAAIFRLQKTWNLLPDETWEIFQDLTDLFDPEANYKNYRTLIDSLQRPYIPYLGRHLSDLLFVDEKYPIILNENLINVGKLEALFLSIEQLKIRNNIPYPFLQLDVITNYISNAEEIEDKEAFKRSLELEERKKVAS